MMNLFLLGGRRWQIVGPWHRLDRIVIKFGELVALLFTNGVKRNYAFNFHFVQAWANLHFRSSEKVINVNYISA